MKSCEFLFIRKRKNKPYFFCKYKRNEIILDECKNCLNRKIKTNKGINKTSKKKETVTEKTYANVFNRDKGRCVLCGTSQSLQLHHINGRGKDLTNNINNCVMLCTNCHLYIVHKNLKKYRQILNEYIYNINNL